MVTTAGRISETCTSAPLGSSTLPGGMELVQEAVLSVSGTCRGTTWRNNRSRSSSVILPRSTTVSCFGASSSVRPGGTRTSSFIGSSWVTCSCAATNTYSIRDRNRAASFSPQLRNRPRRTSVLIEQPPQQHVVDGGVPLRGADHFLHDDAVAVDDEALGYAGGLIGLLDLARPVVQDIEAQPQLPGEGAHRARVVRIDAHRQDAEVGPVEAAPQPLHGGHLDAARLAPRGPDVEQQDLPAVVGQPRGAAGVEVDGVELRGGRADADERDLGKNADHQRGHEHGRHREPGEQGEVAPVHAGSASNRRIRISFTGSSQSIAPIAFFTITPSRLITKVSGTPVVWYSRCVIPGRSCHTSKVRPSSRTNASTAVESTTSTLTART